MYFQDILCIRNSPHHTPPHRVHPLTDYRKPPGTLPHLIQGNVPLNCWQACQLPVWSVSALRVTGPVLSSSSRPVHLTSSHLHTAPLSQRDYKAASRWLASGDREPIRNSLLRCVRRKRRRGVDVAALLRERHVCCGQKPS